MQVKPVVITRPMAQAEAMAQKLAAIGRTAIKFPLLEIKPLPDQATLRAALAELPTYALVAFVGPNAIDSAFRYLPGWPVGVAIAVMGEGSRMALARHGITETEARIFMPRDPERSDSDTLLQALDLEVLRGHKALIVRGDSGRELLADALRSVGCEVTQVAAYRRSAPSLDDAARQVLKDLIDTPNDWVVTSSEALRNLVQMAAEVAGADGVAKLQRQHLWVSHVRIEENARYMGFVNVTRTGSGDERLLDALKSRHE